MTLSLTVINKCDICGKTTSEIFEEANYYSDYIFSEPPGWIQGCDFLNDGNDSRLFCPDCFIKELIKGRNKVIV